MPSATTLVLADAQATPVNHSFLPIGVDPKTGTLTYVDQSASSAIGFWRITADMKQPSAASAGQSSVNRSYRVKIGLHEPVLETLSNNSAGIVPAPTVAYVPRAFAEFVLPERATLQNRKDIRKMLALALATADVIGMVENLQTYS